MATEWRRPATWLLLILVALLASALTLTIDRGIARLSQVPTPTPTTQPPIQQVVVQLPTTPSEPPPPPGTEDETRQAIRRLEQAAAAQRGDTFVIKSVWLISFAMEALLANDIARADGELVAAKSALDEAFALAPEDIKPQLDTERLGISRIRGDLMINPRGLDDELSQMRDRLLSLLTPRAQ